MSALVEEIREAVGLLPISKAERWMGYRLSRDISGRYLLRETAIKVNFADPGYTATALNGDRGTQTIPEGAAEAIRLALLPDDGPSLVGALPQLPRTRYQPASRREFAGNLRPDRRRGWGGSPVVFERNTYSRLREGTGNAFGSAIFTGVAPYDYNIVAFNPSAYLATPTSSPTMEPSPIQRPSAIQHQPRPVRALVFLGLLVLSSMAGFNR